MRVSVCVRTHVHTCIWELEEGEVGMREAKRSRDYNVPEDVQYGSGRPELTHVLKKDSSLPLCISVAVTRQPPSCSFGEQHTSYRDRHSPLGVYMALSHFAVFLQPFLLQKEEYL